MSRFSRLYSSLRMSVLIVGVAALAAPAYADIYGTPTSGLIQRTETDFCTGCLLAYVQVPGAGAGQTLLSWSFYADLHPANVNSTGNLITPVIFDSASKVKGIGTTRTVATNGALYSYSFGTVAGTDVLAAGDWLGWRDGGTGVGSQNDGHISLDLFSGPGIHYDSCPPAGTCINSGALSVGDQATFLLAAPRTYSVNFTTPEPGFYGVLALGLCGLVAAVRRRRQSAS
jgi:hypothetical protein